MMPIDRTEIETWGKKFDAKGNFPKLIAKLIRETTPKSTTLQVPSGSAVNMSGWDAIVRCEEPTGYVPAGISLWEIGANGKPPKAKREYRKRTENSLGFEKREACFVFITTQVWEKKDDWVAQEKQNDIWQDVKAYDSRDIAEWLECAQVSLRWFSILAQNHPYDGIYTVEEYWKMLSMGPKGQLPPKIVTAGREQQSMALFEFMTGKPALKAVKGATKEEAIAFIIASAMLYEDHPKELFFSRSVVVDDEHKFHGLRINKNAINLIAKIDVTGKLYVAALDNGHHVLVPLGADDNFGSQDTITLPRIDRDGQVAALEEMGLSKEEAYKYSKEAGRDYTILKNLLKFPSDQNKWKHQDKTTEIIPALLMGRWDETKEGDKKVIEQLSGESYPEYSAKLSKWLKVESPPLIKIGASWRLTSPLDAWTNLFRHLSPKDFENLKTCFLEVMQETNPTFKLEPNQRFITYPQSEVPLYSAWCREGLSQSMILIGLHGDKWNLPHQHSLSPQEWVDSSIKELLYEASGDLWASRNHEMPLLAEASPESFFESVEHALSLDDKPIMDMFLEEDGFIAPTSHHTGLLWALEALAWTEEYVCEASLLLARLAALDPGGRLANRPINSLRAIYKPWHYQTLASFEDRMKVLEQIIKKEPKIGWELLSGMISKDSGYGSLTHKLRWRLFEDSFDNRYLWAEIFKTHSRILELLMEHFDYSERRLIDLLENSKSKRIQSSDREKILSFIESSLAKVEIADNSAWHKLRGILSHHRSHPDEQWALPEDVLKRYETLYKRLKPDDLIKRVIWMFNTHWPNFPEGLKKEALAHEEQGKLITERRVAGLQLIYREFGFEKVKDLAKVVKEAWIYGDTLAQIIDREEDILSLCEYLKENEDSILRFIQQFILQKSLIHGVDWVFELYEKLKEAEYTDTHLARIFYRLEQAKPVWAFIDKTNTEIQRSYWKGIDPRFWNLSVDDIIYGIDKLIRVNRFISALNIAYHRIEQLPTEKLVEILKKVVIKEPEEKKSLDSYRTTCIIEELEKREDIARADILHLEWSYLPLLASYGSGHKPKVLHEELANNPDFFIEVLTCGYISDNEEEDREDILDETIQNRAHNVLQLFHSWKSIPGVDEDGGINEDFLWHWINKVRDLAKKSGRLKVADVEIGQVLAEYPEKKEPWPPKEICNVIDTINTDELKNGFSTATFNKRGLSARGVFEGGDIEREHAEYFYNQAKNIRYEFPETSKILIRLAKKYEKDAKQIDKRTERDKLDS